jgi:hypothetical protein
MTVSSDPCSGGSRVRLRRAWRPGGAVVRVARKGENARHFSRPAAANIVGGDLQGRVARGPTGGSARPAREVGARGKCPLAARRGLLTVLPGRNRPGSPGGLLQLGVLLTAVSKVRGQLKTGVRVGERLSSMNPPVPATGDSLCRRSSAAPGLGVCRWGRRRPSVVRRVGGVDVGRRRPEGDLGASARGHPRRGAGPWRMPSHLERAQMTFPDQPPRRRR